MTYRYVVYDIEKSLKKTFDDADITFNQILYWVMVVANRLRVQQTLSTNTDFFTSTYCPVDVLTDSKGRKYIDLPAQIMDLPDNAGVVYITYNVDTCSCAGPAFAQTFFQGVNLGEVQHLYLDKYTTPSAKSPYFYRVGDRVNGVDVNRLYLLGLECIDVTDVEIAIKASLDPKTICDLDDELPLPDELIQMLITEVLQLGRFVMMIPEERINIGEDDSEVQTSPYSNPKLPTQMIPTQSE
jgi:hypothetical protein